MRLRLAAVLTVTAVCAVLLTVTSAPATANHAWANYHWARTANPFTLKLGTNVDGAWLPYLQETSSDWSASAVLDTTVVAGSTTGRRCRATSGRIEVCNATYGNNGWLGLAQIWVSGDHITAATAKMNDSYFNTSTYNLPAWRRLVMCQEVAHGFGLGHQNEAFGPPNLGSCMDYTNDPDGGGAYGPSNEHPNAHDFDQLALIYSHIDGTTTISGATATGSPFDLDGPNDPRDFGRSLGAVDQHGRSIYFERDLGGGRRLITHVYWVEPRMPGAERAR